MAAPPATHQQAFFAICAHCGGECTTDSRFCPTCGMPRGATNTADEDRFIGSTLPGGHHILDLISVGGMGRVYRAEQSVLGRTVAVKIIHPHLLADENTAVRFLTEARAASRLNHPNSVSVFDFGRTDDGQPYLVMEFLRGKDLAQVAYDEGPLAYSRIIDVLCQVLAALGEAHDLGIVHRDLKPENIILQPLRRGGDFVKVVDFGLAKVRENKQTTSVTSPGIVCGTPDYMAPEQGRGDHIDGRSDLYAVGVILFQLLTGRLPFEGESPTQVVMMHLSIPPPDPRQIAPQREIPEALSDIVKKALTKNPSHRFQDAHEFSEALRSSLDGTGRSSPSLMTSESFAPSFVAGETVQCEACGFRVPSARFCCECAAPLPHERSMQFPTPFLEREDDMAWLEARLPSGPELKAARVIGEPGVGKTRLLEEFAQAMSARGEKVITLGPDPAFAGVSKYTLAQAVRALGRLRDDDIRNNDYPDASPDAARGLHELFHGAARNERRSPVERRFGLAEALRWALVRSASVGKGMPILIIDDLERVDGPSSHAVADVVGEPPPVPTLIVGAHTPGAECGWGAKAAGRVLDGLDMRAVQRFVGAQVPLPNRDRVLPLYLDHALRHQFEGGGELPGRLGDLVALRIETLGHEARRLLQGLAVLGDDSPISDLAQLLELETPIEEAATALLGAGMATRDEDRLSTSHPLIRDIARAGIPVAVRRELHRRALHLADDRRSPLEIRARHAFECQEAFQALLLLEQVADRATGIGDSRSEVLALRRGLEIARQEISRGELDDPLRAVLIFSRKLGASLTRAGDFADAEGVLREALDLAGPMTQDRAKVLGALAHVAHGRRRRPEAIRYLEQAIDAAQQAGVHDLVATLEDTRRAWSV